MIDCHIRQSSTSDLLTILDLQTIALESLSTHYDPDQIKALIKDQASARLADETRIVAERQDTIVGFAAILLESSRVAGIYVHPELARQGIGTQLLETIESMAMDRGHKTIDVFSSVTAEGFYRANGYQLMRSCAFQAAGTTWVPCIYLKKRLLRMEPYQQVTPLDKAHSTQRLGCSLLLLSSKSGRFLSLAALTAVVISLLAILVKLFQLLINIVF